MKSRPGKTRLFRGRTIGFGRIGIDLQYVFLNIVVSYIPSWTLRRLLYRGAGMKIGQGARIGIGTQVVAPERITLGVRSVVNERCYLDGRGGLSIGTDSSISMNSTILTGSHDMKDAQFGYREGRVSIGDRVWVGAGAIVLDASVLEDEVVLSAGSVLKGTAKEGFVYRGVPAIRVGSRELKGSYLLEYRPFFR